MNFSNPLMKTALVLGALYFGFKYAKSNTVKGAILGVGGVIAAKQVPIVKDVL